MKILFSISTSGEREGLLKESVLSVVNLKRTPTIEVALVLIDNSQNGLSSQLINEITNMSDLQTDFELVREFKTGIPHARNAAIRMALNKNVDWLVYFDDDATLDENWLLEFELITETKKFDVLSGPQIPIFENSIASKFKNCSIYGERKLTEGKKIIWAATNNVAVKMKTLKQEKLFFSEDMLTGGSDKEFFLRFSKSGASMIWSNRIKVFEKVLPDRLNNEWIGKRSYRIGLTERRILQGIHFDITARLLCFLKSIFYIVKWIKVKLFSNNKLEQIVLFNRAIGLAMSSVTKKQLSKYV